IPSVQSDQMRQAQMYAEARTCFTWRNGIFAADGTTVPLFVKPSLFRETFFNQKSNYSLNCQLVIMPHNLMIVDYALGQPGSIHDSYAFQGT
ncbi:hypothetical protein SCLCIDRAFT_78656, partial [Scleroderma citrinum Foug A]